MLEQVSKWSGGTWAEGSKVTSGKRNDGSTSSTGQEEAGKGVQVGVLVFLVCEIEGRDSEGAGGQHVVLVLDSLVRGEGADANSSDGVDWGEAACERVGQRRSKASRQAAVDDRPLYMPRRPSWR